MKKVFVVVMLFALLLAICGAVVSAQDIRAPLKANIIVPHNYKYAPFDSASPRWTVGNIFYDYDLSSGRVWMGAMADAQSINPLVAVSFDGPIVNHIGPTSVNTGRLVAGVKVDFPAGSLVKIGDGAFSLIIHIISEDAQGIKKFVTLGKVAPGDIGEIDAFAKQLEIKNPDQYKNSVFWVRSKDPLPAGKYYPQAQLLFRAWNGGTYLLGNGAGFQYFYLDQEKK